MNKNIFTLASALVITLMTAGVSYSEDGRPWLLSISANIGTWDTSDLDNSGRQNIGYAQLAYDGGTWGALVTGSYADTSYNTENAEEDFTVSTFTDSALSTYYLWNSGKFSLRAGVDASFPTGKSSFSSDELQRVITDDVASDLMLLNSYGAGPGVRPHFAMTYSSGMMTWGLGGKYVYSGEYDPTTDNDDDNFDPGDSITLIPTAVATISKNDFLMVTGSYTTYGNDTLAGETIFKNGDRFSVETRYIKKWSESFRNTYTIIYSSQAKNELADAEGTLASETGNSNANSIAVIFNSAYSFGKSITMMGILGYKKVEANDQESGNALFDGGRVVIFIEPGVTFRFNDSVYATGKLRYTNVDDRKDAFSPTDVDPVN